MKSLFLCESCGKTVSYKAQRCPYCGRFFTAVICPSCTYTASAEEFLKGCPKCGYLSNLTAKTGKNDRKSKSIVPKKKKKSLLEFPPLFYKLAGAFLFILLLTLVIWYLASIV